MEEKTRFCKYCGAKIPSDAVICMACGRQVKKLRQASAHSQQSKIVINNVNSNVNKNIHGGRRSMRQRSKWVALLLCLLLGYIGAHKFYECKTGMGILYLFTFGLFGIGWFVDTIALLFKPNPYYI